MCQVNIYNVSKQILLIRGGNGMKISLVVTLAAVLFTAAVTLAVAVESDGSVILPAYKAVFGEEEVIGPLEDLGEESAETDVQELIRGCNEVQEYGIMPFPGASVYVAGHYRIQGKASWLPPDPGDEGKLTIEGVDTDGDCVRDDIELLIAGLLPMREQQGARYYLFEYARWRGVFLQQGLSGIEARHISEQLYIASECTYRNLGNDTLSRDLFDLVFAKFHNTFPRSDRYIANSALLGGWNTRKQILFPIPCL